MAEVAPEDVAEVQAHANAAIMQAHTTIRQEIPAGTLQQSFISYVETMVHKIMSEFVAYGRLTKAKVISLYHEIVKSLNAVNWTSTTDCILQGGTTLSSMYMGETDYTVVKKSKRFAGVFRYSRVIC
ncbi:hypothetical protein [Celerinatantimonas sp. MCCC 1A17872]|uniref:hypothetical protein n=1 Tax=Celerinatantimonas sp. MCCC 1A17872 TaxID=3177514 RepID=UPI0038C6FBA0